MSAHRTYRSDAYLHCRLGIKGWICLCEAGYDTESLWVHRTLRKVGSLSEMEKVVYPHVYKDVEVDFRFPTEGRLYQHQITGKLVNMKPEQLPEGSNTTPEPPYKRSGPALSPTDKRGEDGSHVTLWGAPVSKAKLDADEDMAKKVANVAKTFELSISPSAIDSNIDLADKAYASAHPRPISSTTAFVEQPLTTKKESDTEQELATTQELTTNSEPYTKSEDADKTKPTDNSEGPKNLEVGGPNYLKICHRCAHPVKTGTAKGPAKDKKEDSPVRQFNLGRPRQQSREDSTTSEDSFYTAKTSFSDVAISKASMTPSNDLLSANASSSTARIVSALVGMERRSRSTTRKHTSSSSVSLSPISRLPRTTTARGFRLVGSQLSPIIGSPAFTNDSSNSVTTPTQSNLFETALSTTSQAYPNADFSAYPITSSTASPNRLFGSDAHPVPDFSPSRLSTLPKIAINTPTAGSSTSTSTSDFAFDGSPTNPPPSSSHFTFNPLPANFTSTTSTNPFAMTAPTYDAFGGAYLPNISSTSGLSNGSPSRRRGPSATLPPLAHMARNTPAGVPPFKDNNPFRKN